MQMIVLDQLPTRTLNTTRMLRDLLGLGGINFSFPRIPFINVGHHSIKLLVGIHENRSIGSSQALFCKNCLPKQFSTQLL